MVGAIGRVAHLPNHLTVPLHCRHYPTASFAVNRIVGHNDRFLAPDTTVRDHLQAIPSPAGATQDKTPERSHRPEGAFAGRRRSRGSLPGGAVR